MSASQPLFRVVTPTLASGVTNGALNQNIVFTTGIPLDYYMNIKRIRWFNGLTANGTLASNNPSSQIFAILTENVNKTNVVPTDSIYLDIALWDYQWHSSGGATTQANFSITNMIEHYFPEGVPTVAQKINLVATMTQPASNLGTETYKPAAIIEYELQVLSASLRDYLAKRIQLQQ